MYCKFVFQAHILAAKTVANVIRSSLGPKGDVARIVELSS